MTPTIGRIVHFVLDAGPNAGQHRPAIIVRVWAETLVQLQVFTDSGDNPLFNDQLTPILWRTSVSFDETGEKPRTWHWPEQE